MSYCSKQDMIDRFGQDEMISLTDRNGMSMIDDDVLNQAIADATATINGYLGGRCPLPFTQVPETIKPLCCNITRYNLYDEQTTEQVTKRYDDAIKYLLGVSEGKISLGITAAGTDVKSTDLPAIESAGSVFSRGKSTGFI
ncbi:DUF1320 domain-containing protein [Thalassomonas viridans]|uniref:DUF1320 domain-containing protein n=1 Tax=Thalassomonas viridans TaxID=137584 RepID=A0AAF0CCD8_9GAMM|nr:DUF1320 domain-containing protein [Thalassomonas viridans]WDE07289.1 DUF1320 domain-containing protein [Thalassomonas viridans]